MTKTYLVTIKSALDERDVYVSAKTPAAAIRIVRKSLTGFEARWASVFLA